MTMFAPLPQGDSRQMELAGLKSSPEVSPARTSVSQGGVPEWGLKPAAGYGLKSSVSFASYDPASSSWRTSQTCLVALLSGQEDGLAEFSETWPSAGMMRNGRAYRLEPWGRPMSATGCGYWPTPAKSGASPRKSGTWTGRYFIKPNGQKSQTRLEDVLGGRPSPTFLEWLMGFPISWTDVHHSGTP